MRAILLAAVSGLAIHSAAFAETTTVDEVIITSTRLPSEADDVPSTRVIDRADIERRQAIFAADVLKTVPGLSVFRNGAYGGITAVRIRGASADKTLVLVDGVPVNDPSTPSGAYDFSSMDLGDVERIEVLSGPQGSIWGSDAIGGVVSFTTRELNGISANAEGGSFGTLRASATAGVSTDAYAFGGSVAGFRTDGISAADERDGNPEADGFETWTAGLYGRVDLSETVTVDGRLRYNSSDVDIDGYNLIFEFGDTDDRAENRTWTGHVRVRADGVLGLDHTLLFSTYQTERFNFSAYEAERQDWRYTVGRGGVDDVFSFLAGVERDDTQATVSTGEADLGATSAFAVARWRGGERFSVTGSLRYDDPDEFQAETTARLGGSAELGAGFSLAAAFGQGFKTPSISQSVCDFCFVPQGPLDPERAEGWDASLSWASEDERFSAEVTGYRLAVSKQIAYVGGRYVNIDRTQTTGLEVEAEAELTDGLTISAEYAYADAVDRTTGARLIRVPEHAGSVSLDWQGDRLSGGITVRAEGEQADSDPSTFSPSVREGFVTADLTVGYTLTPDIDLYGRVENLADEHFQETLGYGEPGRAAYVGIRLRR